MLVLSLILIHLPYQHHHIHSPVPLLSASLLHHHLPLVHTPAPSSHIKNIKKVDNAASKRRATPAEIRAADERLIKQDFDVELVSADHSASGPESDMFVIIALDGDSVANIRVFRMILERCANSHLVWVVEDNAILVHCDF
jgi:hypothetical protein